MEETFIFEQSQIDNLERLKDSNNSNILEEDKKSKNGDKKKDSPSFLFSDTDISLIKQRKLSAGDSALIGGELDLFTNPEKYPFQLRVNEDNNKLRALQQSNWNQFGNAISQGILDGVIGQSIGAVGSIGGIVEAGIDKYIKDQPADFNNILIEWANGLKEFSQEEFPIYKENPSKAFDVGDFAWWAQGSVSVASTIGLLIPGLGAAKIAGRGSKFITSILKATPKTSALATQFTEIAASSLVMRNAESFMESSVLANDLKESLTKKWKSNTAWEQALNSKTAKDLQKQGIEVTKGVLSTHLSAKGAWRAYHLNSVNLLFDVIQMSHILRAGKFTKITKAKPKLTNISTTSKTKRLFNSVGGTFLRQSTEGIEEAVNFVSTEEGRYYGNTLAGDEEVNIDKRSKGYLTDGHFWESAFWGVIGGVTFEGTGKALNKIVETKRKNTTSDELAVKNFTTELIARKALIDQSAKKIKALEEGGIYIDEDNKQHDLSKFTEAERTQQINDIRFISGINLGILNAKDGNIDTLLEQVKDDKYLEALKENGIIKDSDIKEQQKILEENIKLGEKIFNKSKENITKIETSNEKEENIILAKAISLNSQKEFLQNKLLILNKEESVIKNDSFEYKNLSEENPSVDRFLAIEAINIAKEKLNEDLAIQNGLFNEEKSKETILLNLDTTKESLLDSVKDDKNPFINSKDLDIAKILDIKSDILFIKELQKEFSKDLSNLGTKQSLDKIKDTIKKKEIENKKLEQQEIKDVLSSQFSVNNTDTKETIISKIEELKEIINTSNEEENIKFKKEYNSTLKNLEFALKKFNNETSNTFVEDINDEIDPKELENIQQEFKPIDPPVKISFNSEDFEIITDNKSINLEEESDQLVDEDNKDIVDSSFETVTEKIEDKEIIKSINPKEDIRKGINPKNVNLEQQEKQLEVVNPEFFTNIVLALDNNNIIQSTDFQDTENLIIESQSSIYELLNGNYKEGDTVKLQPQLENTKFANPDKAESIAIAILGREGKILGYLNSIGAKEKFITLEKDRLMTLGLIKMPNGKFFEKNDPKERLKALEKVKTLEEELSSLKQLRNHIFENRASFSLASFPTKISKLTSGSIINIPNQQKIKESFGEDIVLYLKDSNVDNKLNPVNKASLEAHNRLAYDDSTLNNLDSIYTSGVYYTLINTPNGLKFPVPLQSNNLSDLAINKIFEGFKFLANGFNLQKLNINSPEILKIKNIINELSYVGKNNIEIFSDNIKIINRNEKGNPEVIRLFFNKTDSLGNIQFNVHKGILQEGKFKKESSIIDNPIEAEKEVKEILSKLLYNPNKKFVNKKEKYISPLSKNFDGSIKENPIEFDNYLSYLNDANILSTNVGTVKDENNNIISNFSVHGKSNLKLAVSTEFKIPSKIQISKAESLQQDDSSITSIIFSKFESFSVLKDKLKLTNNFDLLYKYADNNNIKITNKAKVNTLAGTHSKTGNISFNKDLLAQKESEGSVNGLVEEVLAHEIVHGFLIKEVLDKRRLDKDLLDFITLIKSRREDIPNNIKSLISYALESSPQEIVTLAYTNVEFSKWLDSISFKDTKDNIQKTLLTKLKEIIKSLISSTIGFSALDLLDNIISNNIEQNINIKETKKSLYEDDLNEFFGFPKKDIFIKSSSTITLEDNINPLEDNIENIVKTLKKFAIDKKVNLDFVKFKSKTLLGTYNINKNLISLNKTNINPSTFLHELSHPFITYLNATNPILFEKVFLEAKNTYPEIGSFLLLDRYKNNPKHKNKEEYIVRAIEKEFKTEDIIIKPIIEKFLDFLKTFFGISKKVIIPNNSTIKDLYKIIINNEIVRADKNLNDKILRRELEKSESFFENKEIKLKNKLINAEKDLLIAKNNNKIQDFSILKSIEKEIIQTKDSRILTGNRLRKEFNLFSKEIINNKLTGGQEKEAIDVLSSMFIKVAEKSINLSEDQNKQEFLKFLKSQLVKENYNAKDNLIKVINNFDTIWNKVVRNIEQNFKLTFNENTEQDTEFLLEKGFDSIGSALERNVKDTVPNKVKDLIRRTPLLKSITKENQKLEIEKSEFLQFPRFLNFDATYPYLQNKLSNITNGKDLIQRLENLAQYIPSFSLIKQELLKDELTLSAWISHFDKQIIQADREIVQVNKTIIGSQKVISSNNSPSLVITNSIVPFIVNNIITESYDQSNLSKTFIKLNSLFKTYSKDKNKIIDLTVSLFEELGINYNNTNLKDVINKELLNPNNLVKFTTESNILDNLFIKKLGFVIESIKEKQFDNYNDILSIAKILENYTLIPLQNSYLNINGKVSFGVTLPNFLSKFFKPINNNDFKALKSTIKNYLKVPSLSKSNWVNKMFITQEEDIEINKEFFNNFYYKLAEGLRNTDNIIGVDYKNFNSIEWDLNNLVKYNRTKNLDFYEAPILIPADSSNIYYLNVPKFKTIVKDNKIQTNSPSYKAILNTVYQEIETMKQAKDLLFNINLNTGEILGLKENLDQTQLLLNYHYKQDSNGNKIFLQNNKPVGNVFKFQNIENLNNTSLLHNGLIAEPYNNQDQVLELKNEVNKFIQKSIIDPAILNFEIIKPHIYSLVFEEPYRKLNIQNIKWNNFIKDFAMNSFINNNEMLNLFYGNISEYKSKIDIGKRLKEIIAPGQAQSNIKSKGKFTIITLKDIILQSSSIEPISNNIKDTLKDLNNYTIIESKFEIDNILNKTPNSLLEVDVFNTVKNYFNVNATDAQGYITLDRFEKILFDEGRLTEELEKTIEKVRKGEQINREELKAFLEPVKGFYYDRFYNEDLNLLTSKQIKYSTFPLISALTKGTHLDKLRIHLESNNIDEAIFESAVKVGSKNITKIHNNEGNLLEEELKNSIVETLDNSKWQRQLDVPDDIEDKQKLLAVQISRIIFGNTSKNKDFKLFSDIMKTNLEEDSSRVIDDLGFKFNEENELEINDIEKTQKLFLDEIEKRGLPSYFKEALEFKGNTNKFKLPLFVSSLSKKFQSIFLARFTKNVTDQTIAGFSAVQFSSAFINKIDKNIDTSIIYDSNKDSKEPLSFVKSNNGWIAEVLVSPYDSKFFKNGKLININDIPEESRTFIAYRIPTDAKHSMITFKVVGFLPRESSSSIIVPKELTTQQGGDFDVDKLFIIRYNLNDDLTKIEYDSERLPKENTKKARENKIIDLFKGILTNKKNILELIKPSIFTNIKEITNLSNSLYNIDNTSLDITTYTGQKELRNRNLSGQALTGISANFNTFAYLAQKSNLKINSSISIIYNKTDIDIKFIKQNFTTGNETINTIEVLHDTLGKNNNNFQNINKIFITDILGENLASAVDTVKEPLHPSFNSNIFTFPIFSVLNMLGVDHKIAGLFINQPVIKDLSSEFFINNSSILDTNNFYIEEIRKTYEDKLLKVLRKSRKEYEQLLALEDDSANNYIGYTKEKSISLSLNNLKDNIKHLVNPKEENLVNYYTKQLEILETFLNYKQVSDETNDLIRVTKTDNLGTGPNISLNQKLLEDIKSLDKRNENQESIALLTIDGENAITKLYPELFDKKEEESKYPIIQDYLIQGNIKALKASEQLFIQGTQYFNDKVLEFLKLNNISNTTKNINKITNNFIARLVSKVEKLQEVDFNSLLGLNDNISLAENLFNIKNNDKYKHLVNDSGHILNYLQPDLSQNIKKIKFNNINDPILQELIYDSFKELYNSSDPVLTKLAEDLFKYSFISNGLSFSASSFSSFLPIQMYEDFGIVKELEDSHKKALSYDQLFDDIDLDIIIRNNWNDNNFIPKIKNKQFKSFTDGFIEVSKTNKFISNKIKNSNYLRNIQYRDSTKEELEKNPNAKTQIEQDFIYQKIGETEDNSYYMPIPKLGEKGIIDFYDNINTESKSLYDNFSYKNVDEAFDILTQIKPEIFPSVESLQTEKESSKSFSEQRKSNTLLEKKNITKEKLKILNKSFNNVGITANIAFDENIESNAQVENINGVPFITLNPNKVFEDTVIHEFGHIYIDLLGFNSPQIQFGINQLRNTELWNEIKQAYPELNQEKFEKEVLVTAIGREGANIFKSQEKENRFIQFLNNIWKRFANLLGLSSSNVAKDLAFEMINAKLQRTFKNNLSFNIEKSKDLNLSNLQKFINKRILDTKRQINRFNDDEFTIVSEQFIEKLNGLDKAKQILEITDHINKRIIGVKHKLDIVEADLIPNSDNFNKLFNSIVVLNSFEDLFNLDTSNISEENKDNIELLKSIKELNKAILPLVKTKARLKEIGENLLREKLKPLSSNPEVIEGIIDIYNKQEDANFGQEWFDSLADANNTFLSLLVKDFNIALDKRTLEGKEETKIFERNFQKIKDVGLNITDFLDKEKDGTLKDNLITEFNYTEYADNKDDMWAISKKLQIDINVLPKNSQKRKTLIIQKIKLQSKWFFDNEEKITNYDDIITKKKIELTTENSFNKWKEANSITIGRIQFPAGQLVQPKKSKYKNKDFEQFVRQPINEKEKIKQEFYNYLTTLFKKLVNGNHFEFLNTGQIPAVPLDTRSYQQALKEDIARLKTKENVNTDNDKLVNVDEAGNILNILVQPYLKNVFSLELQKVPENASIEKKKKIIDSNNELRKKHRRIVSSETNLNLEETIPEFIKTSLNFKTRKEFESQMLLASEIFKFQEVEKRGNFTDKIASTFADNNVIVTISAKESAFKRRLDNFNNMVYYDNFEAPESENLRKVGSILQNTTSLTQIGFNPLSGLNNKMFGTLQNIIEAKGGFFFNKKEYRKARKFYNKGDAILSYLGGRNKNTSTTKQESIIKHFDIYQSQAELSGRKGGPIRTVLDKFKILNEAAYAMQSIGEHTMQNVSLFAMMESHKFIEGKIISRNDFIESKLNNITKDMPREQAILLIEENKIIKKEASKTFETFDSLIDNYELKEGYLEFKKGINISIEEFSKFRQKVISVNQYLHGIYNKEDAGMFQKYVLGRLALQMRKWTRPGWNKRFGSKFGQSFWNERREAPDEGMYVTTYTFIKDLLKDYKELSANYTIHWHSMSEFQKSNVRKTSMELSLLVASYLLFSVAQALGDDNEELKDSTLFNVLLYQMDRTWKEILTFYPPFGWYGEGQKILNSPTASSGILVNTYKLAQNTFLYPFRTEKERHYQSGVRYGQNKITSGIIKVLPLVNKVDRVYNIRKNNEFYSLLGS